MSGRMANPTQNAGYEPNLYSYLNEEHKPNNLSDSFQCRDDATIISAAEDPEVRYSGASSSSKQIAASRVTTMLGSSGASPRRQRPELVDSRASTQATIFSSHSKGQRDRDQNVMHSLRERKSPENL